MAADPDHRIIPASQHRVPRPFATLAVRSDEPAHAGDARVPWGQVHAITMHLPPTAALQRLAAAGLARVQVPHSGDIDYAPTSPADLAGIAPELTDLVGDIARALQRTGVLGDDLADYRASVAARIDFLGACGAGFHNDVTGRWSRSLFWLLALDLADVAFVMPHAGVELPLSPGDLLVFDQTMAHGLCRPRDQGQAVAESFEAGDHRQQIFLTGELLLSDAQWAAIGAPWRPVEWHDQRGALDLMVAEFDERTGTIQRPQALRDSMKRSTCHVNVAPAAAGG